MRRIVFLALTLCALSLSAQQRVIVLGFDGVDAKLDEQWMNEGKLPNLARLRAQGTFRPLRPTVPAQTPVSWSTFSTGIDPGRTGIFDFLRRDPKTYLPVFAAFDETKEPFGFGSRNPIVAAAFAATKKYIPETRPGVINRRQGIPFWDAAAQAGKKAVIVHVPVTFPATDFKDGHMISGLGVPAISCRVGNPLLIP